MIKQDDKELREKKVRIRIPHTYVILFSIIVIAAIATYIVPAGQFERVVEPVSGRNIVAPDSFHLVEQNPTSILGVFFSMVQGFISASDIIFLIFFAYANVYVIIKAGAFHGLVKNLIVKTKGKQELMIPIFMLVFGLAGSTYGEMETIYAVIPVFVGIAIAMGYDAIVGLSMTGLAVATGFASATTNPFTIGIAQGISELPLFSGLLLRWIIFFVFMAVITWYTMRYAAKIKKNPELSVVMDINFGDLSMKEEDIINAEYTWKHKLMITVFLVTIAAIVFGTLNLGWYINEMSGLFLLGMIICGVIAGYGPSKIAEVFIEACSGIVVGAMVVGLARSILVIMQDGNIIDSVVYGLYQPLKNLPSWASAQGMLVVQNIINFFIPSGSGQATAIMPIMAPLADLAEVPRQVAVLAYQFGDGYSNLLWPTATIAVMCGVSKVPLDRWYKYFLPLFGIMFILQIIFLSIAVAINYGPF